MSVLRRVSSWLAAPGPTAAIEIAADRVTGVVAGGRRPLRIAGHATEPLPAGAVEPAVARSNIVDRTAVAAAVRAVVERLPNRPSRVGVVVPDSAAKVSLVKFDTMPKRVVDLDPMVRWQVKKAVPFKLEDAQVGYTPGMKVGPDGREFLVVVMRRDIVEEYEAACTDAGLQPGVVDLATLSLINGGLAGGLARVDHDWLLVHAAAGYQSVGILRGQHLVLFRNHVGTDQLSDLVHQSAMYYEDRLGGAGLSRVLLAKSGSQAEADAATEALAVRLGAPVETVRPPVAIDGAGAERAELAAPIGLLARDEAWAA